MMAATRRNQDIHEQIDSGHIAPLDLQAIFNDLDLINQLTFNNYLLRRSLKHLLKSINPVRSEIHLVDLGCGSGRQMNLARAYCAGMGFDCSATGVDFNPELITSANNRYGNRKDMTFVQADILDKSYKLPECDIVIASQFIYRFSDNELVQFLKQNRHQIQLGMILSEISRNRLAAALFPIAGKLLGLHQTTIDDGLVVLKKAWKPYELEELIRETAAFQKLHSIKFPFRYTLTCS